MMQDSAVVVVMYVIVGSAYLRKDVPDEHAHAHDASTIPKPRLAVPVKTETHPDLHVIAPELQEMFEGMLREGSGPRINGRSHMSLEEELNDVVDLTCHLALAVI